ncbi:MAG: 2Fe-2S iron-sulfur cluster-binding protein [Pseudomonadota bacterium]
MFIVDSPSNSAGSPVATVAVSFIDPQGNTVDVAAPVDGTLMEAAFSAGVEGILAECGGGCSCGTCHVILSKEDFERLGEPDFMETGILDFADNAEDFSRLSCQIEVTKDLEGMCFRVAG